LPSLEALRTSMPIPSTTPQQNHAADTQLLQPVLSFAAGGSQVGY